MEPYCVITGENAWSKRSSEEVFAAVPDGRKRLAPNATVLDGLPVEMTRAERGDAEHIAKWLKQIGQ